MEAIPSATRRNPKEPANSCATRARASPVVVPPPPPQDLSPDEPDNDADDLGKEPDDHDDGD